jgi:nucleotide-binding universal stress UspA family protein
MAGTSRIVVGYDGSESAQRALEWATEEAKLRNTELEIVGSWEMTGVMYSYGYVPSNFALLEDDARKAAEKLLAECAEDVRKAGVEVVTQVRHGQAADELAAAAKDAGLLVVGSRGHGGFAGLLLGSVSAQLAHHARCPLVIVR